MIKIGLFGCQTVGKTCLNSKYCFNKFYEKHNKSFPGLTEKTVARGNKTIQLNGIGDYFKHVFIPSRKRSNVDEIRYISKTNIKAVEVKDDGSTVVYYQFVKVNGKWLVHIPTL